MAYEFTEACKQIIEGNITSELLAECPFASAFMGGAAAVLLAVGIVIAIFLFLGLYVYFSFAWYTIGKQLKYKNNWLAWVPIARISMILQLGGFHWAWVFLILIPVLGWIPLVVLMIISKWRIFEKRKYQGWLSLFQIIPKVGGLAYMIILGFVAWSKK